MKLRRLALAIWAGLLVATPQIAAQEITTIILVRHAETRDELGNRDPELSAAGQDRARELVRVLGDAKITAVYSTPLHRTLSTARPTADRLGLEIKTLAPTRTLVEDMAEVLREDHAGETVLVVNHSNTVPAIINALGAGPYEQLGENEYDDLFVVTLAADGTASSVRLKYGQETP